MDKFSTSLSPMDMGSELNSLQYIIYNMIVNSVNTMTIVKVTGVGDGRINVIPVMKELTNDNEPIDNTEIKGVRYLKLQAGGNLVDLVPEVGDIGILLVSKQDTSGLNKDSDSVCQTTSVFNLGDGVYLGSLFGYNPVPSQYIKFENNKVTVKGTSEIVIDAPTVKVNTTTATVEATTATIKATNTTLESSNIKLGGSGASKAIALHGDQVKSGSTVVGTIVASSTTTKAL